MRYLFLGFLVFFSSIGFSQNRRTYETGDSWVTRYLDNGGNLNDITGLKRPPDWRHLTTWKKMPVEDLPTKFDWNELFRLQEVRNQRSCGSCWAFSVTAVLESLYRIAYPEDLKYDLAEQETLSCSGSGSCGGGYFDAFDYLIEHGVGHEDDFPYTASNQRCKQIPMVAKGVEWHYIGDENGSPSTEEMKSAIYNYGPISVDVNGSFGDYESGVYNGCGSTGTNHMVVLDGWVDDPQYERNGGGYWIMRNSWGQSWGEAGYMKIVYKSTSGRKCNGIGGVAAYAVLQKVGNLRQYLLKKGKKL